MKLIRKLLFKIRRHFFPRREEVRFPPPDILHKMSWGYRDLYKLWGIRMPFFYFFEVHLFDLINGTDTHTALPQGKYLDKPENFDRGTFYMATGTNELKNSFKVVQFALGENFSKYSFVDLGCGKGKAMLVWQNELNKRKIPSPVIGIEYYAPLVEIARQNYQKVFHQNCDIHTVDATNFDFSVLGQYLMVYMFNPFDAQLLDRVLSNIANSHSALVFIYLNPIHSSVLVDHGYKLIYEKKGWNNTLWTMIFCNDAAIQNLILSFRLESTN